MEVYAHYPKVRLTLNGQVVTEQTVTDGQATFTLPYQPGTLKAEGLDGQDVKESVSLTTAGEPVAIRLTADHQPLKTDGQDLAFVTVELVDANGMMNPTAANRLKASVSGPATIVAFGNADIKDCDPYTDHQHQAWKGRALLVLRSTGKKGKVTVSIQGEQLKTATLRL